MKMLKVKIFFLVNLLSLSTITVGQIQDQIKIIPPSPEEGNLGRYGEVPIGYYNGSLSLSVPITNLESGKIQFPIALNYSSEGGVKISERANDAGLGWSLSASNVVTRVVFGKPDEKGGFLTTISNNYSPGFLDPIYSATPGEQTTHLESLFRISKGCFDFQTDIFYYNFAGNTGKFFFDWNGEIVNLSSNGLKISYTITPGAAGFTKWVFTTETGTKYIFNDAERTIFNPLNSSISLADCDPGGDYNSAWYLSRIEDIDGNIITLNYEGYSYKTALASTQQATVVTDNASSLFLGGVCGVSDFNIPQLGLIGNDVSGGSGGFTTYFQKRIKSIIANNAEVTFDYNINRTDIEDNLLITDYKSLDVISLKYNGGNRKQWDLIHDYSTGRLTLKSVVEKGENGAADKVHKFSYNGEVPGSIFSKGIDHWGYFNGNTSNVSLVPSFNESYESSQSLGTPITLYSSYIGADRSVDPSMSILGLLNKVVYPTGGSSEFNYEAHDCSRVQGVDLKAFKIHNTIWSAASAYATAIAPGTILQQATDTVTFNYKTNVNVYFSAYINSGLGNGLRRPKMFIKKKDGNSWITIRQEQYNYTAPGTPQPVGSVGSSEVMTLQPGTYLLIAEATSMNQQNGQLDYANIELDYPYEDTVVLEKIPVGERGLKVS